MAAVHPPQHEDAVVDGSAALYRLIAETIPLMVWIADDGGQVDFVNRRILEYSGLDARQLEGWNWQTIVHPDDWERCLANWSRALQSGERSENEMRLRRADGAYRWHHGSGVPMRDAQGRVVRWFGICADIEDRVRSAQILEATVEDRTRALRESEQRFRAFMDNAPAIAWIKDASLRYTFVNRAHESVHGRGLREMQGRDDFELWPPEVARQFRESDEAALRGGRLVQRLETAPDAHGRHGHWLVVKFPLADTAGGAGVAGIGIDITERVEAEGKAARYAADVRNLLDRLIAAQESERRLLADELHDLIGQNLTAFGIELGAVRAALPEPSRVCVEARLDAIRGVMSELRPPALEEFGLVPALLWYASVFGKRTGMDVSTSVSGRELRLPRDTELALFRIVQEALTNAAKHSGGARVQISLAENSGSIRLAIEDDGRGFADPVGARGARRGGWGLPEMRERAQAHGGSLRIEFPGRGTRVIVELPGTHAD
jgi:PAS domain S-box-containing protein